MSDEQTPTSTPATPAPPDIEAVGKMGPGQVNVEIAKFGADAQLYAKFFSGDGQARKLFDALMERKRNTDVAESLITAATDPEAPQPFAGGMLRNGVSRADEVAGARHMLETGASIEELAEFEIGAPMASPEDFRTIERRVRGLLGQPDFTKRYLSGDPDARALMDRWHRIATLSRPLPPVPRFGIAK